MTSIQIVKLAPEDWHLYKQIRLEALLMEPQAFVPAYAEVLQRPDSHWQERLGDSQERKNSWLLFAKENEHIIGMIGAYCPEENDEVDIISVYVTKEKRGQGVASALMAAILAEVSRGDIFRKAVLSVNAEQTAAVALYRRFGFQIVGEKSGVMSDGKTHSGYVMEKELGHTS